MNPETFIDMQCKIKENQNDLQNYLKDLESWENEVKGREKVSHNSSSINELSKQNEIPIRNSHLVKKKKKKQKDCSQPKTSKRISSYDYRAWDKFDVDKACDDLEEENAAHSSSESETDEEWEEQRRKQQAIVHKDQGNQYLSVGKYVEAIECYTQGIESDGSNAILFANRAMALLKQQKYAAAEEDCTSAISLDPTYLKAYFRRASARGALGKHQEAADDLKRLLKLEPGNKDAKTELAKIELLLKPPSTFPAASSINITADSGIVKAVYKPPELRSKKPLRRVNIEEIGKPIEVEKPKIRDFKAEEKFSKFETSKVAMLDDFVENKTYVERQVLVTSDESKNASRLNGTSSAVCYQNNVDENSLVTSSMLKTISSVPTACTVTSNTVIPPVPSTSYQFQADWKRLKTSSEQLYSYFKAIPTSNYVRLFGESFDDAFFCKIIALLDEFYIRDSLDVIPVLAALSEVKRFSTILMFLDSKHKEVLTRLFRAAESTQCHSETKLSTLKRTYGL